MKHDFNPSSYFVKGQHWLLMVTMSGLMAWSTSAQSQNTNAPTPGRGAPPAQPVAPTPAPTATAVTLQSLGEKIFNDRNLSQPAGTACANCHNPATGFSSLNGSKIGVPIGSTPNSFGIRNAMQNAYSSFVPSFSFRVLGADTDPMGGLFWDGRADTLATQAMAPLLDKMY